MYTILGIVLIVIGLFLLKKTFAFERGYNETHLIVGVLSLLGGIVSFFVGIYPQIYGL